MLLYKIIPDEFPLFKALRPTPVREHIPAWRERLERQPKESAPPPVVERRDPTPAEARSMPPREPTYSYTLEEPKQMPPVSQGLGMVEKPLRAVLGDDDDEEG